MNFVGSTFPYSSLKKTNERSKLRTRNVDEYTPLVKQELIS